MCMDFSGLYNIAVFNIVVKLKTPLHIGGNFDQDLTTDLPILKTVDEKPYIPGSLLKGILRSASERLLHIYSDTLNPSCMLDNGGCSIKFKNEISEILKKGSEEEQYKKIHDLVCPTCRVYGTGSIASKIKVKHVVFSNTCNTTIRDGIMIDRETGTVAGKAKFDYKYVEPGESLEIVIEAENMMPENQTVLALALLQFKNNMLRIGGLQARGLGEISYESGSVSSLSLSSENRKAVINYMLNKDESCMKKEELEDYLSRVLGVKHNDADSNAQK